MSSYSKIKAEIHFIEKQSFEASVKVLRTGGWINSKDLWIDEAGKKTNAASIDYKKMIIIIPLGYYLNLVQVFDKLTKDSSFQSGQWASADNGYLRGGDLSGNSFNLKEWSKDEGLESEPNQDNFSKDEEYFEELYAWQDSVIDSFLGEPE